MKKITFYYVRHGLTLFNVIGRIQGWSDSPLMPEGIKDAEYARDVLKDIPFAHAYSSTSERCTDTAKIVLEGRDVPLTTTKQLKEMSFGRYEGMRTANHREDINRRRMVTLDWSDAGGENYPMLIERILGVFQEIYDESQDGDNILVISHGAVFLNMIDFMFHLNRDVYVREPISQGLHPVPNGLVARFNREGDEYHLEELYGRTDGVLEELYQLKENNQ